MPHLFCVANLYNRGKSCRGRLSSLCERLARSSAACGEQIRPHITTSPGDAERATRDALERGARTIVSIGGDGTHNEVVNGFFTSKGHTINPGAVLGVIPAGTGNDFRRSLGLSSRIEDSLAVIDKGQSQAIDIGRIEYTGRSGQRGSAFFANVASAGLSGIVDHLMSRSRLKWTGGTVAFAAATAQAFFQYRNRTITVAIDGGKPEEHLACAMVAANGLFFGGGMKVAPDARLDDGLLDFVRLGDFHLHDFILRGHRLYSGAHLGLQKVWHRRAREIVLASADRREVLLDVDGEQKGVLPARISVMPSIVRVFVPQSVHRVCLSVENNGRP